VKTLQLTKGKVALVDDDDFYWLAQWNWQAVEIKGTWYAVRQPKKGPLRNGGNNQRYLHRVIARVEDPDISVDHRDHDGLNNQKANLRICSRAENNKNISSRKSSSSVYLGVSWDKKRKKWLTQVSVGGKNVFSQRFASEVEAAKAYDKEAIIHHEEFANLNFK
jgi:hypothetical protein